MSNKRKQTPTEELVAAVEQAIVDLSVSPTGCEGLAWYENVCLEVAERLDDAASRYHMQVTE